MKFKLLLFSFLLSATLSWGQVTIFSENMGTPASTTAIGSYTGWQNNGVLTFTGTGDVRTTSASSGYTGSSGGGNVFITNTTGIYFEISGINTTAYTGLTLTFGELKSGAAGAANLLVVEVSSDGTTYTPLTYSRADGAVWALISPTGTIPSTANLRIRFRNPATTQQFRVDDVVLKGTLSACTTPADPTTTDPAAVCQGNSATITGAGSGAGATYTFWDAATAGTKYVTGGGYTVTTTALTTPTTLAAGTYTYYVQGESGTCISVNRKAVTVTINPLPATPPAPTAVANPSCGAGTLNVMVPPAGETYFWQGTTSNGTSTTSSTASTYNVASSGTYYVRSRNNTTLCWSAQSSIAMTVNTPVAITVDPVNRIIANGANTTFSVTATGTGLGYQWQVDTGSGFVNLVNGAPYSTVTTATLNITGATLAMNGYLYRCVVSGTAPCTSVTSNSGSLTVNNVSPNNPTAVTACYGNTSVALSWTASSGGTPPDGYMVFALLGATTPASATPGNASLYTANSDFSLASVVTASLGKCVYKGAGTSATITGLTNLSSYSFKVVAYIGNTQTGWSSGINANGIWNTPVTNVVADVPEVSALAATVASGQSAISWTRPTPIACNDYLVVANQGAVVFTPTGDGSAYTANPAYAGANQVVYKGTGTGVTVTGLTDGQNYCYKVFVRDINTNSWSDGVFVCQTPLPVIPDNGCATSNYYEYTINQATSLTISDVNLGVKINHPYRGDLNITLVSPLGTTVSLVNFVGGAADNFDAIIDDQGTANAFSAGNHTVDGTYDVTGRPQGTGVGSLSAFNGENAQGIWKVRVCDNAAVDVGTFVSGELFFTSCTSATLSSVTPTSGPVGTEVTINASAGNLSGATVKFNGVTATIISNTSSQIVVTVPTGATTGNIVITAPTICNINTPFTVIDRNTISCEGGTLPADLFFSEVTDSNSGSLSYVEIYNGTGATVNLSGYSVRTANNGGAYSNTVNLNAVNLINGGVYVVALGDDDTCTSPGGDGSLASQSVGGGSVNFSAGGNDHIGLFNGATLIDSWGTPGNANWAPGGIGTEGVDFRRKITATVPSTTFNNNDWDILDYAGNTPADCANNDYSNIGLYNKPIANPANIAAQPSYIPSCTDGAVLSVTATEGFVGGLGLTYQWYFVAPGDTSWTAVTNGGVYSGATTNTLTISSTIGLTNYQFYCQVREDAVTCFVATKAVKITSATATTWNGSAWDNGAPDLTRLAIINGNYDTLANGNFMCCSLVVNTGFTLEIASSGYVVIQNEYTNNGTINIRNNASLVQINDAAINSGNNILMQRNVAVGPLDYVYWSSPVSSATQTPSFPVTSVSPGSPSGFVFKWDPVFANTNGTQGNWISANENMILGKGYILLGRTDGAPITANFTGKANNGVVSIGIARGSYQGAPYDAEPSNASNVLTYKEDDNWNLVGNPYPSALRALDFLTDPANTNIDGFVNIWTHGTLPVSTIDPFYQDFVYNYTPADYITYNGVGTTAGPAGFNGYIAAGQSFFVSMIDGPQDTSYGTTVSFRNSMRRDNLTNIPHNNSQFYRNANSLESGRIWLDIVSATNATSRALVGYVPEATMQRDRLFDAITKVENYQTLYTLLNGESFNIQGRSLPFDDKDLVPVGFYAETTGNYTIALGTVDGFFTDNTIGIYLEDKLLNVIHDLRQNPYAFTSAAGRFDSRFVLRYTDQTLSNSDFDAIQNGVVIFANDAVNVSSSLERIKDVVVYDVLGRVIAEKKNVSTNTVALTNIRPTQSALIVKVTLENGQTVSKKVIY